MSTAVEGVNPLHVDVGKIENHTIVLTLLSILSTGNGF